MKFYPSRIKTFKNPCPEGKLYLSRIKSYLSRNKIVPVSNSNCTCSEPNIIEYLSQMKTVPVPKEKPNLSQQQRIACPRTKIEPDRNQSYNLSRIWIISYFRKNISSYCGGICTPLARIFLSLRECSGIKCSGISITWRWPGDRSCCIFITAFWTVLWILSTFICSIFHSNSPVERSS